MLSLSLAQLRAHISRLVATVLAIVIAVGFVVATLVLNQTSKTTVLGAVAAQFQNTDTVVTADLSPSDSVGLEARPGLVEKIKSLPGVTAVAADSTAYIQARLPERRGYQFADVQAVADQKPLQWQKLTAGRLPTALGEIAIGKTDGIQVGSKLTLLAEPPTAEEKADETALIAPKPTTATVVGLVDLRGLVGGGDATMFATTAQTTAWGAEQTDAIRVAGAPGTDPQTLTTQVNSALADQKNLVVQTGEQAAQAQADEYTGDAAGLTQILLVFATVAVLVCGLVIANTFAVLLAQRTRELALLRCVGATGKQLRRGVLVESLVIGAAASLLGVGAGIGLAAMVSAISTQFDSPIPLAGLSVPPMAVVIGMVLGIVVTVVAAFAPARRATRVSPLAALRPIDPAPARSRAGLLRRGAGVLLLIPSVLALGAGSAEGSLMVALPGGVFSFIAAILLSQWLVPPVVALVGRLGGPAGGVPGRLAASNALRNPQRTAATATALIIGVTLTATMVVGASSTRATAAGMLDRAFATDIVVSGSTAGTTVGNTAERALAAVPDVAAVMPLTGAEVQVKGKPDSRDTVLGIDPGRAPSVVHSVAGAGIPAPGTVNVPNFNAEIWGQDGSPVTVAAGDRSIDLKVHIVSGDSAALAMTSADLARLVPKAAVSEYWIRLADGLDTDARRTALNTITDTSADLAPGSSVQSSTQQRDDFDQIINALLMIVTALLGVAVIIALIGVGNTIALSVVERRQESGLLRALGLTRAQLRWMLLWEAVLISAVASLLGLALGAVYGSLATSAAFGDENTLQVVLPWGQLLIILAVATVAGALASVLPSRRAARISPVAAIAG